MVLRAQDSVVTVNLAYGECLRMVWVEGGTFVMGHNGGGDVSHSYEASRPEHQVTVSGFYMSAYEVTQGVWRAVMDENPSHFVGSDSLPVEQVTWSDAQRFVTLLSQQSGRRFRLPTEAEWEYAARGGVKGTGMAYAGCCRDKLNECAWFCVNSKGRTHVVGGLAPNELGLYDMSGNVAEWCSDWMENYSAEPQQEPAGPRSGDSRIVRGGHFYSTSPACAVFDRGWYVPSGKTEYYGFRVVMEPLEEDEEE